MKNEMKYDVFISYRRSTGLEMARTLSQQLDQLGVKNFFDLEEIQTGLFDEKIYDSIDDARYVIFIFSKKALDRCVNEGDWVRNELEHAYGKGKTIIPVSWIGQKISYPDNLPETLNEMRNTQVSFIDRGSAFRETVLKMARERLLGVDIVDDEKRHKAEEILQTRARRYKENDYVIDPQERADLEKLANELGIDAVTREAIIEKVECECTNRGDQTQIASQGVEVAPQAGCFKHFLGTLKKVGDYRGVSGRKEFWSFVGIAIAILLVALVVDVLIDDSEESPPILFLSFYCALGIPYIALAVRRARDCGFSVWFGIASLLPYIGWAFGVYLGCMKGGASGNQK